ncbi:hypothetical protein [Chitinibacter sp. ZOR0017]|uniref:hypothetical protein n=1 Tax=Chitinibacter sp. ZOR0017 TaxID=1339254 RepID=UPI0012E05C78|nr:hypothetical protein [Chitinibacter sp. ZOR0017]
MKRLLIVLGCFFLLLGLFHESLPIDLARGIWSIFSSNSRPIYFRIIPTEQVDYTQVLLLSIGALLVLAGLLRRSFK